MRKSALLAFLTAACTGQFDMDDPGGDGPPGNAAQVLVLDGQSPQAGVLVLFEGANGAVTEVRTDATGMATAELASGGNVTVVRTYPTPVGEEEVPAEVYTYVGVKPGERLSVGKRESDQGPAGAVLVKVPDTARGTVVIQTPCGRGQGEGPLVAITVRDCAQSIGVYVEDGDKLSFWKRVPYGENIDVSAELLVDGLTSTLSATNVPAGAAVNVEQRLGSEGFDFYTTGPKRVDQTPATVKLPQLAGVEHLTLVATSGNNQTQVVATRAPFAQGLLSVDASAGRISAVSELQRTDTRLTWTEDGAGAADAVVATFTVTRPDAAVGRTYVRHVIAPHAGPSLQLPALAGAGAAYNPVRGDQIQAALGIAKVTGGYDAIRARAFSKPRLVDATPLNGQITLSYTGTAPGR